jgi:hypothetical protein
MADTVEKVSEEMLWNQNAQRSNPAGRSLESNCLSGADLESIFLKRRAKILFQQRRPQADLTQAELQQNVEVNCITGGRDGAGGMAMPGAAH